MKYETAIVIGAGAFGTALSSILSHNFKKVICKVRSDDVYEGIKNKENKVYLPGFQLQSNIVPALTFEEVKKQTEGKVELIVSGLPTSAIKKYCDDYKNDFLYYLSQGIPVLSLSKGIDAETLEMSDDLYFHHFQDFRDQFCFLSGPSFAKEILEKQITVVSVAGRSTKSLKQVNKMLETKYFKVMMNYDVKGVLLGGALKNVLAIAGGVLEGLGYNHNTRAAMITRGIAEMLRFGKVFNSRPESFYGLSGMGDLILTVTSGLSRNKTFGLELAKGRKAEDILASQRTVVEGHKTALAVHRLAEKYEIRCRIFQGVYQVLYEDKGPDEVIHGLLELPSKFEID